MSASDTIGSDVEEPWGDTSSGKAASIERVDTLHDDCISPATTLQGNQFSPISPEYGISKECFLRGKHWYQKPNGPHAGVTQDSSQQQGLPLVDISTSVILHRFGLHFMEEILRRGDKAFANEKPIVIQMEACSGDKPRMLRGVFWERLSEGVEREGMTLVSHKDKKHPYEAVQALERIWPKTLSEADALQKLRFCPEYSNLRWEANSTRPLKVKGEFTLMTSTGSDSPHVSTRRSTGPEASSQVVGSICYMSLNNSAEFLSVRDIAHVVTHLLGNLIKQKDLDSEEHQHANKITMRLVRSLGRAVDERDNMSWGPWNDQMPEISFHGIIHHFKCLSKISSLEALAKRGVEPSGQEEGIHLNRQSCKLLQDQPYRVGERRFSIVVTTRYVPGKSRPDWYNGICIVSPGEAYKLEPDDIFDTMRTLRIEHCGPNFAPVVCFLTLFACNIRLWYDSWVSFLDSIDKVLHVEPMDIFSGDKSEDSVLHGPFSHPNALFDLLQLLRTANFWIQATQRDFHKRKAELVSQELRDQRLGDTAWPGINLMEQNWERVEDALEKKSAKLVRMIDRKTEEIQILREGLFHATSLREASRGTKINEYMFVFTCMTIIYLPLSFIATLYGNSIDFFNFHEHSQQLAFGLAMTIVSAGTYLLAYGMHRFITSKDKRQKYHREIFKNMKSIGIFGSRVKKEEEEQQEAAQASPIKGWDLRDRLRLRRGTQESKRRTMEDRFVKSAV